MTRASQFRLEEFPHQLAGSIERAQLKVGVNTRNKRSVGAGCSVKEKIPRSK